MKRVTETLSAQGLPPLDKFNKAALTKANDLMRTYREAVEQKQALQATIADKLKNLSDVTKDAEENLILIGQRHRFAFDEKGNFHLEDGYLHIAQTTVIETTKKFNPTEFMAAFPELIDIKLKTALVKKEWLNKEGNKELKDMGVRVDTTDMMQVIANKKID
jgi:hypothetical protein